MNTPFNTLSRLGSAQSEAVIRERNRVLRNTYWLLALSMVPTILGAWLITCPAAALLAAVAVWLTGVF